MLVIQESVKKTGKDLYPQQFEFRYCTGSIELEDDSVPAPKVDSITDKEVS